MADARHQRPTYIDYHKLSQGLTYYEPLGYTYMEVPWVIGDDATTVTLPADRVATSVSYGNLVGSGEQSFIQLLLDGIPIQKACCITPCFRDEQTFDTLHHAYFMKLELINTDDTLANLHQMIDDALGFYTTYLDVEILQTGPEAYDIVDTKSKTELGSYGFRSLGTRRFIYGTGVALPRLDTVLKIIV